MEELFLFETTGVIFQMTNLQPWFIFETLNPYFVGEDEEGCDDIQSSLLVFEPRVDGWTFRIRHMSFRILSERLYYGEVEHNFGNDISFLRCM